jgi:N-acetyl-alpha-D-glucosaminyl L-malate synthase BshA
LTRSLHIGVVCLPGLGGSGVIASELALGLAARGHDVHLIAAARPARAGTAPRLTFHPVRVPRYPVFEHPPYTLAVASLLVDVARAHALDVLHVHYAVPHAASALLARAVLGAGAPRLVTSLHGTDVAPLGADPAYRSVTAHAVAASDAITVPSAHLRREAFARLGLAATTPVEIVPNFVDTDRFAPGPQRPRARPVLFHVSNLRPVKRARDLVEVLARVRRDLDARLVVVGDGPDASAVEDRAAALGVAQHVQLCGRRADFVDELRGADAFVLPSETESFGVAALEALSAGVPVFGYRVGGLPEVVVDGIGRLVEPFDTDALAAAIVETLAAPAAHAQMARAARAHVLERYRRDPAIDRYLAIFNRILERP